MVSALSNDNLRGKSLRRTRNGISSPCIYRNDQGIVHGLEHSGEGLFQQVAYVLSTEELCDKPWSGKCVAAKVIHDALYCVQFYCWCEMRKLIKFPLVVSQLIFRA